MTLAISLKEVKPSAAELKQLEIQPKRETPYYKIVQKSRDTQKREFNKEIETLFLINLIRELAKSTKTKY